MSRKFNILGWTIFIFHLIGALGTIIPETRAYILPFTPLTLVLSVIILIAGDHSKKKNFLLFFLITFLTGYFVEVIGVSTGFPFGTYTYGNTLGPKILQVPLVIGLNWFMLTYSFGMLYKDLNLPDVLKAVLAAISMVMLDVLIEPVAVQLDYWKWESGEIPIRNYIGWFCVAMFLQYCFTFLRRSQTNKLIIPLIVSQIFYFTSVFIFY